MYLKYILPSQIRLLLDKKNDFDEQYILDNRCPCIFKQFEWRVFTILIQIMNSELKVPTEKSCKESWKCHYKDCKEQCDVTVNIIRNMYTLKFLKIYWIF